MGGGILIVPTTLYALCINELAVWCSQCMEFGKFVGI